MYEIVAFLGAGGMGEVYRARDTKLRRDVALKILPDLFARDPDRVARFTREAHLLASLNHPGIAAIYGFEESADLHALVLELVEGPTLAERLARGPIPIPEALPIATQIAEALEVAHEKGIVHRDLKPANIKLPPDAGVKILDFGLAKALADDAASDAAISPTMTELASRLGMIVGTAAYMSPEQAKGRPVDKRTDIWAFGCVLYEMLTARAAFAGETVADVLVTVMTREPDWLALPAATPPRIVELLRRCVKKEARERLRDIGDARLEIAEAVHAPRAEAQPGVQATPRQSRRGVIAAALVAGIAIGALAVRIDVWRQDRNRSWQQQGSGPVIRTAIELPASGLLALGTAIPLQGFDSTVIALSPDGRHLAYVGQSTSGTMLYLGDTGRFNAAPVAGTEGAIHAFFSPDNRWLGFLTNDKVKKIQLDGGAPITLCDARVPVRASWTRDDAIYFGEDEGQRISRVSAAGGSATVVVPGRAERRTFSQVLPDGSGALATAWARGISTDYADVILVSLRSGDSKVLIQSGYDARYVPPGYLLFGRGGNLLAVRFDLARGDVSGDPQLVVSGASMESFFGQVHAAVSDNGLIAYVPGGDRAIGRLAWVDRQGRTELLPAPARLYGVVDLSPNGERLAVHVADVTDSIWVYDIRRGEGRKLAVSENSGWPIWSPDNATIAFAAWLAHGRTRVLARAADAGGPVQELVPRSDDKSPAPASWSPDGRVLALESFVPGGGFGFFAVVGRLPGSWNGRSDQWGPDFSPDGRWVTYASIEGGRHEIVVRSYPDGNIVRQFSADGGLEPVWCPCGELFYRNGNRWMSAKIRTQPDLQWDPPRLAFETDFIDTPGRSYDVSPDGQRLLVVKRADADARTRVNLVVNWTGK